MRAVLLLGRKGSGKGTLGRHVQREGDWSFLSAGELLRQASRAQTSQGERMRQILAEGRAIAPEMSYPLIATAIARLPPGGVLLDGCPNRSEETDRVRDLLAGEPALVIELHLPLPLALARLRERLTCRDCETPYGPTVPAGPGGRCRSCGGEVLPREDDSLAAMGRHPPTWDVEGRSIMRYYEARTRVVRVDAARPPAVVANEVVDHLRDLIGEERGRS